MLMTEFRLADIKEAVRDSSDVISVNIDDYNNNSRCQASYEYCMFSKYLCFHKLFLPMRSGIVFLISFCLLSTTCIQQRQKLETKECSTTQADTSFIVVDSTLLLYLKKEYFR